MQENSFEFATPKQYKLAISVKERIICDIENMKDINKINQLANTNFDKEELQYFFKEKNDFKYFINQNNISTNSIIVSAMMKLKRN
ncbi:hypothetical protein [Staphylococcus saprophyticus]|jgi:hypothetical protein|uniref:hypothetical protein n=1 Tax=Staphylococcus saprophyticus TaxID=29385 RepID=UPI001642C9B7|nr:hypothetical protein [Staphylococcus saprophyticus]MBC2921979.1 hypothetical protein [Staphylococcus saprophyticus]MBC2958498.1 hypothetical protein [Staphylococcus saprophyticus]MBC3010419.1 hypothetical protein [Staphylococcus saprophyticus]MBC3024298.1 hypothetical protein [Staphylococcus saprophyticus]MBC3031525.1 hypothetical protein [Staphylococcus saprophyticus]